MENTSLLASRQNNAAPVPEQRASITLDAARKQVDRILASDTLRASESVQRLLRFLADKSLSGEAYELKEYSIGVDGLGKPPTFDPRHDAGVRLLASRVRLKLDEYYSREGFADQVLIEMPRGRFKITWKARVAEPPALIPHQGPVVSTAIPVDADSTVDSPPWITWRTLTILLGFVCLLLSGVTFWLLTRPPRVAAAQASTLRSSDLDALWQPFIAASNHVVIAFWNPVFVRLQRTGKPDLLYRQSGSDDWDELIRSTEYAAVKRLVGGVDEKPTLSYTMRGSLVSIFNLTQFFAGHQNDISLVRLDQLYWQQVADHNIVLIAPWSEVQRWQAALPTTPAFIVEKAGIRNLRPTPGEPAIYADPDDPQQRDGETVELVSMMPGPLARTRVLSFAGIHSSGLIGSVQSLTDPAFGRLVVSKLKQASGQIPPYFQMVLRVKYRDETPTDVTYITHRQLMFNQNAHTGN